MIDVISRSTTRSQENSPTGGIRNRASAAVCSSGKFRISALADATSWKFSEKPWITQTLWRSETSFRIFVSVHVRTTVRYCIASASEIEAMKIWKRKVFLEKVSLRAILMQMRVLAFSLKDSVIITQSRKLLMRPFPSFNFRSNFFSLLWGKYKRAFLDTMGRLLLQRLVHKKKCRKMQISILYKLDIQSAI